MSTPDIRVGDLIRATRKDDPELVLQGRVRGANPFGAITVADRVTHSEFWDYEVLDRPVPKVEDDLLDKVIAVYRGAQNFHDPLIEKLKPIYANRLTPIINAVREYDRSKESK